MLKRLLAFVAFVFVGLQGDYLAYALQDKNDQTERLELRASSVDQKGKEASKEFANILVTLNAPFEPVGTLSKRQLGQQTAKTKSTQSQLLRELRGSDFQVTAQYEFIPAIALRVSEEAIRILEKSKLVKSIAEEQRAYPTLGTTTSIVEADLAVASGFDASGQTVAIIDTGVDSTHQFLSGKVVMEACFTTNNCPNGGSSMTGAGSAAPCPQAGCDHGTHVAGIAAGFNSAPQPGQPLAGVAPGANIIAIQVFNGDPIGGNLFTMPHQWLLAFDFITQIAISERMAIAAANLSLSGGRFPLPCDLDPGAFAVANLESLGVATVVSSGNDGFKNAVGVPGCISRAVTVGNVDNTDTVRLSSNSSQIVDLLAPGTRVNSSVPPTATGAFVGKTGTSMSAPHVAGAFAILAQAFPGESVAQRLARLRTSGLPITDTQNGVTRPRILINGALTGAAAPSGASGLVCDGQTATVIGTQGPDILVGTNGADVIVALGGDDSIDAGGGDDVICAGAGEDHVLAGIGDDRVFGGQGNDVIHGQFGDDAIDGGSGEDVIHTGAGDDVALGGFGNDILHGEGGVDQLAGGPGADHLFGGERGDTLSGGDGNDVINGQAGNDTLIGGDGSDFLLGEFGADVFNCGAGAPDHADGGLDTDADALAPTPGCESAILIP